MTAGREDPLRAAVRGRGEAPALVTREATWSYRRLDAAADRVARLVTDGISARAEDPRTPAGDGQLALSVSTGGAPTAGGPTVATLLPRGARGVAALHGVPRTGAASAPLHPGWTEPELSAWLRRLRPDLLLCVGRTRDRAAAVAPAGTKLVRLPATGDLFEPGGEALRSAPPEARPGAVHTVIATSGTSGRPRAVPLTLANHLASARGASDRLELRSDDRWLASLSPAHVGGVAMAVRAAVLGCVLVLRASFDAEELLELAEAGEVTHASLVPVMLRRVLEATGTRPPGGLRCLLVGGDAADPDLVLRGHGVGLPVALTYGLTEAASQVATAPPERARRKPDSVGRPLPGVEVRISEEDEILVRGPTVASGAALDEATIGATSDGWLPTGDAGRLDGEGDLHVTGRLSDRIVTGGVTVDPAEVERVLRSHPGVRDAAVVGLPDEEWGERVVAAIEAAGDASGSPEGPDASEGLDSPEGLEAFCRERLAGPKLPRRRALVTRLPRNATGKVDREAVRALFLPG